MLDPRSFPGRPDIEAAFEAILPEPKPEQLRRFDVQFWIDDLCLRGLLLERAGGDGRAPPRFRPCSTATAKRELTELRDRAEKLAEKLARRRRDRRAREQLAKLLRGLHAPTIELMDGAPPFKFRGSLWLPVFSDMLRSLPNRLEQGVGPSVLDMRLLAWLARDALTRAERRDYPPVGRPPHRQAHIIARDLARAYRELTGRETTATTPTDATKSYVGREGKAAGDWVSFVERNFAALGIERAAWSDALRAGRNLRGRGRRK